MGRDLQNITQYQLTNDIVKNHYIFDIKDGALKVLMILSTHYPEIYVQRKSLIKRYKIAEKTADRALKELSEKRLINRQNDGKITLNLTVIYGQIDGEKVVNLAPTCSNQHDRTEKTNKHDNVVVDLLKGFSFSGDEIHQLMTKHSIESLQTYAKYVQLKKAENPKKYLLWCLKEKPVLQVQTKQTEEATEPKDNAQRYQSLLNAKKPNWMNSIAHAQTYLVNTTQFDLRNETILKDCIAIMLHWKFKIEDYNVLMLIDNAAAQNKEFRQRCAKLTAETIDELKTVNLTANKSNTAELAEIAC